MVYDFEFSPKIESRERLLEQLDILAGSKRAISWVIEASFSCVLRKDSGQDGWLSPIRG